MRVVLATGVICLLAGCATTQAADSNDAVATATASGPAAAAAAGDEEVCKRTKVMGSIMPKRVCASAAEWAAREEQELEKAENFDRDRRAAEGVRGFE